MHNRITRIRIELKGLVELKGKIWGSLVSNYRHRCLSAWGSLAAKRGFGVGYCRHSFRSNATFFDVYSVTPQPFRRKVRFGLKIVLSFGFGAPMLSVSGCGTTFWRFLPLTPKSVETNDIFGVHVSKTTVNVDSMWELRAPNGEFGSCENCE